MAKKAINKDSTPKKTKEGQLATKSVPTQELNKTQNALKSKKVDVALKAFSIFDFNTQAIVITIIGFILYANTFMHEYAFDDMMAIVDNTYVQKGISGIPDIMKSDAFQSYLEMKKGANQLAGGRYRPLSLITFAIEQQILGINDNDGSSKESEKLRDAKMVQDMHLRHVVNVLLYIFSIIVLLYFLRYYVFPNNILLAFTTAILFLIHPLHTEVVANVKSRDEILSVLFITLSFISILRYAKYYNKKELFLCLIYSFLALLSKEYAITLVVLLPLAVYFFGREELKKSFKLCVPFIIPLGIYLILRFMSVSGISQDAEKNVMNNPYLYATGLESIATKTLVLFNYLKLLFFPNVLLVDYSYKQIPYTNFTNIFVWVSILLHTALIYVLFKLFTKRHIISFAIIFYLIHILLISNFIFNIGAPMGERLVYHSSIGFVIAIAWIINKGVSKIPNLKNKQQMIIGIFVVLTIFGGLRTILRNEDWKSNNTLFLHDVQWASNSVLVNNDAAAACMNNANIARSNRDTAECNLWFTKAIIYFTKAINLNPNYMPAYLNRGLCYFNSGKPEKALPDWDTVKKNTPQQENLNKYLNYAGKYFLSKGKNDLKNGNFNSAIIDFQESREATPENAEIWYQLALSYFLNKNYKQSKAIIFEAQKLFPNDSNLNGLLAELSKKDDEESN